MTMSEEFVRVKIETADAPEDVSEPPLAADTGGATRHVHVNRAIRHLVIAVRESGDSTTTARKPSRELSLL